MRALLVRNLRVSLSTSFTLEVDHLVANAGTIVAITGANGSGKTSLVRCIVGLHAEAYDTVHITGQTLRNNLRLVRQIVGFIPDDDTWLIPELTASEYFLLLSGLYQRSGASKVSFERAKDIAQLIGFSAFTQRLDTLSHGNIRKVQIIAACMHRPKLIVADEPHNGLDAAANLALEQLLFRERSRGAAIVCVTHDLAWAQTAADTTYHMDNGRIRRVPCEGKS